MPVTKPTLSTPVSLIGMLLVSAQLAGCAEGNVPVPNTDQPVGFNVTPPVPVKDTDPTTTSVVVEATADEPTATSVTTTTAYTTAVVPNTTEPSESTGNPIANTVLTPPIEEVTVFDCTMIKTKLVCGSKDYCIWDPDLGSCLVIGTGDESDPILTNVQDCDDIDDSAECQVEGCDWNSDEECVSEEDSVECKKVSDESECDDANACQWDKDESDCIDDAHCSEYDSDKESDCDDESLCYWDSSSDECLDGESVDSDKLSDGKDCDRPDECQSGYCYQSPYSDPMRCQSSCTNSTNPGTTNPIEYCSGFDENCCNGTCGSDYCTG